MLAVLLPKRSSLVPDVPTIAEAGMPGISVTPWAGLFAPAGVNAEITSRLARDLNAVLLRSDVRDQIGKQGLEVHSSTPMQLTAHTREQYQAWMRIIRENNIPQE